MLLVASLAASLTCGDGTAPGDGPRRLERISSAVDSAGIGDTLSEPLEVRVEDRAGDPVPGTDVRFRIVNEAPGRVQPGISTTGPDGSALARFVAGDRIGSATVRAGLPAHPSVSAVSFTVRTVVPRQTRLFKLSGDGQRAEVGSQLPRAMAVRVTTPDSVPTAGVPVFWSVASGAGGGAVLTADTTFTDREGRARSVLTLGDEAGRYRVAVRSRGAVTGVSFTATAVESLSTEIRIDSVRPSPLRAGDPAAVFGENLPDGGPRSVWVEGEEAEVLGAGDGRLRIRTPTEAGRCLPSREVGVRVLAGERQSNGLAVRLRPGEPPVDLAAGESRVLPGGEVPACLRFAPDSTGRLYRLAVQGAGRTEALTPVRLVGRSGAEPRDAGAEREPAVLGRPGRLPGRMPGASAAELRIRSGAREALRRTGARPAGGTEGEGPIPGAGASPDRGATPGPDVGVGDHRRFLLSVDADDLQIDCRDTTGVVDAAARAVGESVVLYEDTLAPRRGFSGDQYRQLRDEFERFVFPVDTAYFGAPVDIDGNGRVAVVFTPEVNALSPTGGEAFVGGFFLPTDLAESGDGGGNASAAAGTCPVSNEAEVIYLPVPDPSGRYGQEVSRERALRNARSVTAHELEHLLSAEQRVFRTPVGEGENPFAGLESAWLSEGLAHLAEEVVGLAMAGLRERAGLDFAEAVGSGERRREAFNAFHINNFARARLFMRNPNGTSAIPVEDPGGRLSLEMRGFGWLFARFLGDRLGPDGGSSPLGGSAEHRLFRTLSRGGDRRTTGVENVLRAGRTVSSGRDGSSWEGLLADFGIAVAADDSVRLVRERRFLSWDLGDVYAGLHRNLPGDFREGYPLRLHPLDFTSTAVSFDLNRSTAAYFRLGAASGSPSYAIRVTSPDGTALPTGARPQILLVRVR